MIIIRHTHEDGTLIEGTGKGDGVYEIVKRHGFAYFPSIKAIGVRNSRDRVANRVRINGAAEALRAAGYEVSVEIDDTPRARATVLANQAERLDERREALQRKTEKHLVASDAAYRRADEIAARRPFGQPILVGHHSERGARADQRRIEQAMDRCVAEHDTAQETGRRAGAVGSAAARSARPDVTARRIKTAEAELRDIARKVDGSTDKWGFTHEPADGDWREQLLARRAQLDEQLAHDRAALAQAVQNGTYVVYGPDNVHVGDLVFRGVIWHEVVKVNRATVSCKSGYDWMDKVRFTDIQQVRCQHGENGRVTGLDRDAADVDVDEA